MIKWEGWEVCVGGNVEETRVVEWRSLSKLGDS